MIDIFGLDEKGIIPLDGEGFYDFVKRGNNIFQSSAEATAHDFIKIFEYYFPGRFLFFEFKKKERKIEKALIYLRKKYCIDLSWVRTMRMVPIERFIFLRFHHPGGACPSLQVYRNSHLIKVPFIGVVHHYYIQHELIHAARSFCLDEYDRYQNFEEAVAENFYNRTIIFPSEIKNPWLLFIKQAKKKLEKAFGKKHGYVFIRLTYEELFHNIISDNSLHKNPSEYLIKMSSVSLRHWIMCKKLRLL